MSRLKTVCTSVFWARIAKSRRGVHRAELSDVDLGDALLKATSSEVQERCERCELFDKIV